MERFSQEGPCAETNATLKRDSTNLLYVNSVGGIWVTFFVAWALALYYMTPATSLVKYAWLSVMSVVCIARLVDLQYWKKKLKNTLYCAHAPRIRFITGAMLTAVLWGAYPVVQASLIPVSELTAMIIALSAFAGGATSVLSGSRLLAVSYCLLLLTPVSTYLLLFNPELQLLGVLGFIASLVLGMTALKTADFTKRAVEAKNENRDLLSELAQTNEQVVLANENLEHKVQERTQEIYQLSNIDPLSGLYNRKAFAATLQEHLSRARAEKGCCAVLFIDLDGFKLVNDSSGHAIGDKLLSHISGKLLAVAKTPEHVCRWGGDEFILVIECDDSLSVEVQANALIQQLSEEIVIDGGNFQVGATVGVAMYPEHGTSKEQLITNADTAMYVQKQHSRGYVCFFDQAMRDIQDKEQHLKQAIPDALAKEEFSLAYQPVIDNVTGKVAFCEVLIRWNRNGINIPPLDFIPIAEKYGFIHQIGEWVLNKACADLASWELADDIDLSINVSVAQMNNANIVPVVEAALAKNNIAPHRIHIEITESVFAENMQDVLLQIQALHELGILVSVDDFGTGFSSLKQLQDLNADVVKIDKSFVDSLGEGGKAIIQATQYMSKEFGYKVVAEGVETKEQADTLAQMGVNWSQGYYFCKPMPFADLPQWHAQFNYNREVSKLTLVKA